MLKVGDPAPQFTLQSDSGAQLSLASFWGNKILLWFFPRADTPGCSLEGRGFRDHQQYFDENNIQVVGISFDDVERNAAFAKKYDFKFPLASDTNHQVALAYGACSNARAQ